MKKTLSCVLFLLGLSLHAHSQVATGSGTGKKPGTMGDKVKVARESEIKFAISGLTNEIQLQSFKCLPKNPLKYTENILDIKVRFMLYELEENPLGCFQERNYIPCLKENRRLLEYILILRDQKNRSIAIDHIASKYMVSNKQAEEVIQFFEELLPSNY